MSNWIPREHWSMPVNSNDYVEICGLDKTETKRGFAGEFEWSYDKYSEANIYYYKVLSRLMTEVTEVQTKPVTMRLPDDEIALKFPEDNLCGMFMIWWKKYGAIDFYKWIDSLSDTQSENTK
jgi:hypothetical protein